MLILKRMAFAILMIAMSGCGGGESKSADDFCLRILNRENTAEARKWLTERKNGEVRTLGELESADESLAFVEELYAAGAQKVMAVEIDISNAGQNTGKLVIELHPEAKWRKRCFEIQGTIARKQGYDPTPDVGQKYLFIMLD